ncbi:MAG: winged helix-turn-helix transcriptional regulator [Candidatus Bathyarchaeota archaeon]|nr:winged helix-turn-helix transcriptional regulator [Candidatus Bathyarchaeota archaeon]
MYDPLLVATILLLLMTGGAAVLYYRRIRKAYKEYDEAKSVVDDVIISFNKQLRTQENRLNVVAHKTEASTSQSEKTAKRIEEYEGQLAKFTAKMKPISQVEQKVSAEIENTGKRMNEISTKQESIMQRIKELEKARRKPTVTPEAKIEAAIPIKRERALAPLTQTELSVLEILAAEGRKTAPDIRERVKLTREHTARLMKKLYEEGYLERNVQKIPYAYSIKKEMQKILKKESKT